LLARKGVLKAFCGGLCHIMPWEVYRRDLEAFRNGGLNGRYAPPLDSHDSHAWRSCRSCKSKEWGRKLAPPTPLGMGKLVARGKVFNHFPRFHGNDA